MNTTIVETLGRENLVTVRLGAADIRVLVDQSIRPAPGQTVRLGYRPERVHFFDRAGVRVGL